MNYGDYSPYEYNHYLESLEIYKLLYTDAVIIQNRLLNLNSKQEREFRSINHKFYVSYADTEYAEGGDCYGYTVTIKPLAIGEYFALINYV